MTAWFVARALARALFDFVSSPAAPTARAAVHPARRIVKRPLRRRTTDL
ncbi:MAG: hypothetical protein KJ025_18160 [Burkholderiales bacterium]|nr:hypothetical protein [Burkholderiales bacterium]